MLFGIPLIEKAIIYIQITELVLSLFVNKKILQGIWHHFFTGQFTETWLCGFLNSLAVKYFWRLYEQSSPWHF